MRFVPCNGPAGDRSRFRRCFRWRMGISRIAVPPPAWGCLWPFSPRHWCWVPLLRGDFVPSRSSLISGRRVRALLIAFVQVQLGIQFGLTRQQQLEAILVLERAISPAPGNPQAPSPRGLRGPACSAASLSRLLNVYSILWTVPTGFAGFKFAEYVPLPRTKSSARGHLPEAADQILPALALLLRISKHLANFPPRVGSF